jgi:hypothetical protein
MASVALRRRTMSRSFQPRWSVTVCSSAPSLKRWSTRSTDIVRSSGRYRVPDRGLELVPDAEGAIYRRGFFSATAPGLAKAASCLDPDGSMAARGRRHLWISESNALILSRLCESVLASTSGTMGRIFATDGYHAPHHNADPA